MNEIFVGYRIMHNEKPPSTIIEGITPKQINTIVNYCTRLGIEFSYSSIDKFRLAYDLKGKIKKYDFWGDLLKIMEGDIQEENS